MLVCSHQQNFFDHTTHVDFFNASFNKHVNEEHITFDFQACFGSPEVFEYLIRILKLYPKPLDKYKQTPMHFAAYKNKSNIIIYLMSIKEYYNGKYKFFQIMFWMINSLFFFFYTVQQVHFQAFFRYNT